MCIQSPSTGTSSTPRRMRSGTSRHSPHHSLLWGWTQVARRKTSTGHTESKSRKAHPDHGGDADQFKRLQAAYGEALKIIGA